MKYWLRAALIVMSTALILAPSLSVAKRLGGGSSSGMQRSMPAPAPAKPAAPQQAAPAAAPSPTPGAAPAAVPPKRNWMGPIAGLAAGLGLAALMSHLGMGEAFGNFLMLALLGVLAVVAIGFVMRRFGRGNAPATGFGAQPGQLATAGTGPAWDTPARLPDVSPMQRSASGSAGPAPAAPALAATAAAASPAPALPADFDVAGFERLAKMIFIRLQAANDRADLNDLRSFTTPEMFAVAKLDLQERGDAKQITDVVKVDAEVLGLEHEGERQVVSVRFHGLIREDMAVATPSEFDEIWHLVRYGDDASWAIAGIQQRN
jgi:predicted lipid-binding transport protein (Tim44 family)